MRPHLAPPLRLLLEVCVDKNALFLTGDTGQTIARGVGFRGARGIALPASFHDARCHRWGARARGEPAAP